MDSNLITSVLGLAGWCILPKLATTYIQTALYAIFIRAGDPKPVRGSPRFARDFRRIHVAVILLYLLYTIIEADWSLRQQPDFYQLLGVPHDVDERALQSRFRRLTVLYHPDKVAAAGGNERDQAAVSNAYVAMTAAKDTLVEPLRRFAYDRFGPGVLEWKGAATVGEFVTTALQQVSGFYMASGVFLAALGWFGYVQNGTFWRWFMLVGLYVVEVWMATRPHFSPVLTRLINPVLLTTGTRQPYLPFQFIMLLRKVAITFSIALSQLGPLLTSHTCSPGQPCNHQNRSGDGKSITEQQLNRVEALVKSTHQEIARLMGLELAPFAAERKSIADLRLTVKEWLMTNTIRNEPEVSAAVAKSLERRRQEHARTGDSQQSVSP